MGFNMKKRVFVFLFRLFLLAPLSLLGSCLKAPEITQDLGPEVSTEKITSALLSAWGDIDPNTLEKNNFVAIDRTQKILDISGETVVFQVGFTIIDKKESEDKGSYIYDILQQTNEITQGQSKLSSLLRTVSVPKSNPQIQSTSKLPLSIMSASNLQALSIEVFSSFLNACISGQSYTASCHNLIESEELVPPPDKVKDAPNCGGLPDCKIRVKTISFDRKVTIRNKETSSNQTESIHFQIRLSPDVPFLARVMESCFRGMVQVPNSTQRVLVTLCDRVQDFK